MMNTESIQTDQEKISRLKLWLLLFAAGAFMLFFRIGHESLWFDESYTAALISHPFREIWAICGQDSHPPLYFLALKAFSTLFGHSETALRCFSALGTLALAALGFGPVRKIFSQRTGMIYALMIFTLPMVICMSQEARMYTWAAFFVTGAALTAYQAATDELKRGRLILLGLYSLAAAYTHYYALMGITFIWLALLVWCLLTTRKRLPALLLTAIVTVAGYLPWVFSLFSQVSRISKDFWIEPVTAETVYWSLLMPFSSKFDRALFAPVSFFLSAAGIMAGLAWSVYRKKRQVILIIAGLLLLLSCMGAGILASLIIRPVFVIRYLFPFTAFFALALAYSISLIEKRYFVRLACITMIVLSVPHIIQIQRSRYNGPLFEARQKIMQQARPGDVFLHTDEHTFGTFCYYFPQYQHKLYLRPGFNGYCGYQAFLPQGTIMRDLVNPAGAGQRLWLITRMGSDMDKTTRHWIRDGQLVLTGEKSYFALPTAWFTLSASLVNWNIKAYPDTGEIENFRSRAANLFLTNRGALIINLSGIDPQQNSRLVVSLFNDYSRTLMPYQAWKQWSGKATGPETTVRFDDLPYGVYAVTAFMEINTNRTIDYGAETWGSSGDLGWPQFEKRNFVLNKTQRTINVPLYKPVVTGWWPEVY